MRRLTTIAVSVVTLLLVTAGIEAAGGTFVVAGTLVRDDKSLIEGARVMIAEAEGGGFSLSIGDSFTAENPSGVTDAKGRFSITVSRSLFKHRREFVVVVPLFQGPNWARADRGAVRIDVNKDKYTLGKLTHDSPIVR
jgi:hypothetical protein